MTKQATIPISFRAMFGRLNRALAKKSRVVRAPRGRGPHEGAYFIIDTKLDRAVAANLSAERLEEMARELGAIERWEEVER
jgi:hypothetical protein